MRYFTKQHWRAQVPGSDDANLHAWQTAAAEFRQQLEQLRGRLSVDAFQFFSAADVDDGELMSLEIRDGSRPAPRSALARPRGSSRPDPVSVHLTVLDAAERILYDARGNMSTVLMKPDRPPFASKDRRRGTDAEVRAAFEGFDSYPGTYSVDTTNGTVTHHVTGAS